MKIPFNKPYVAKKGHIYISEALNAEIQQGDGIFSDRVTQWINSRYSTLGCLLTPSCTGSLEMAMILSGVKPGDEVILPSFNFTSAATAITKLGGIPVFVDINPKTACLDTEKIEQAITTRTKAISWVNYGGNGLNNEMLKDLAGQFSLKLIEDAAHNFGFLTNHQKKLTGNFVTFSFHATKNIQCGEGGALIVSDIEEFDRARIVREKGTNRHQFREGKVSKYNWVDTGGSYLLAEINSALLFGQIQEFNEIHQRRREIVIRYREEINCRLTKGWTVFDTELESSHIFAVLAPTFEQRRKAIDFMKEIGVSVVSHYEDLSRSVGATKFARNTENTSHGTSSSQDIASRILRFPVYPELSESDQDYIIVNFETFLSQST